MSVQHTLHAFCSWETLGFTAGLLVLAAFYMKDMMKLRIVALCSNLAFIGYGLAVDLVPIWLLHLLLLPMNGCRLLQAVKARAALVTRKGKASRPIVLAVGEAAAKTTGALTRYGSGSEPARRPVGRHRLSPFRYRFGNTRNAFRPPMR